MFDVVYRLDSSGNEQLSYRSACSMLFETRVLVFLVNSMTEACLEQKILLILRKKMCRRFFLYIYVIYVNKIERTYESVLKTMI